MTAFRQHLGLCGKVKMHQVFEMKSFGHGDVEEMLKLHLCSGAGKETLIPPPPRSRSRRCVCGMHEGPESCGNTMLTDVTCRGLHLLPLTTTKMLLLSPLRPSHASAVCTCCVFPEYIGITAGYGMFCM